MAELTGKKILLAEPIHGAELTFDFVRSTGCQLEVGPDVSRPTDGYTEDQLISFCGEADAFIGMSREKLTRRVIQNAERLRIITKTGIGVDHIDVIAATEKGILVTNTPMNRLSVAEFAIMEMLALNKKIISIARHIQDSGEWRNDSVTVNEIYEKTVGILGLGGIGRQVAKRLQGWNVRLIAHDPYIDQVEGIKWDVKMVDRDTLFKDADILTLHLPLTEETKGSVGEREFGMMKDGAILINTARGKIVKESALIEALRSGKLSGAGVDVFEIEPVRPDNPLLGMKNVITSPHSAGFTYEALSRMAMRAAYNSLQAIRGKVPDMEFIVNPKVLDVWRARWCY